MAKNSKDTTGKKDVEVPAKNKDIQDLRGEVGILKQYIGSKIEKEKREAKAAKESDYQKNRLSKNITGLKGLKGLSSSLGNQKI